MTSGYRVVFYINDEFNYIAALSADTGRKPGRGVQAAVDAAAAITAARTRADERRDRERSENTFMALSEIAAAVYRETQARILETFAIDREATRLALAEIEELLAQNEAKRQAMIDAAVKLDDGTAVFLTEDGKDVYTEHGDRPSDEEAEAVLSSSRPKLEAAFRWEPFHATRIDDAALLTEHQQVTEHSQRLDELTESAGSGALTLEELEQLEADYEAPARVVRFRGTAQEAGYEPPRQPDPVASDSRPPQSDANAGEATVFKRATEVGGLSGPR